MDVIKTFVQDTGSTRSLNSEVETFVDIHNKKGYDVKSMIQTIGAAGYTDRLDRIVITVHMSKSAAKSKEIF